MPKRRRQTTIPTPAWERRSEGSPLSRLLGRSFQFYGAVAIGTLAVIALAIVGYALIADYIEDQRRPGSTALAVDDTEFRLDYYSSRMQMYVAGNGGPGVVQQLQALQATTDTIIRQEVMLRFASEEGIEATEEEMDAALAVRVGVAADDPTFEVGYQQELERTGLTDQQYREMVRALVLEDALTDKFQEELPDSAAAVRYRQILVSTNERAQEIKQRIEDGADFASLAEENSLDAVTKDEGGEVGWVPKGVLQDSIEEAVFGLNKGDIAVVPAPEGVYVIEMREKDKDRKIKEDDKVRLAVRKVGEWVQEKRESLDIVNNMDLTDGDPEKIRWAVVRAYEEAAASQLPVPGAGG